MERAKTIAMIKSVLRRNGIKKAYLFGSFARGERKCNDIDIAIVPPRGKFSLFDLAGLQIEMEGKIKAKADISIYGSIKPALRPYIEPELMAIM